MGVVIGLHGRVDFVDIGHKSVRCARSFLRKKIYTEDFSHIAQDLVSVFLCSPLFEVHTPRTISAAGHALMTWDDSSTTNTSPLSPRHLKRHIIPRIELSMIIA